MTVKRIVLIFVVSMIGIGSIRYLSGNPELQDGNMIVNCVMAIVLTAAVWGVVAVFKSVKRR